MSVNKFKSHLLVLPEDRANSDIANGFLLNPNLNQRLIQVLPFERGWKTVVEKFVSDFAPGMRLYPNRAIVLLIDFDQDENRLDYVQKKVPEDLKDRVFVLGVFSEPENLRSAVSKSFEEIGETLAKDCAGSTHELWGHALLQHNQIELERMVVSVKSFLFD